MLRQNQARQSVSAPGYSCLPANDRADEVTAAMLAQLLEQAGTWLCLFRLPTLPRGVAGVD